MAEPHVKVPNDALVTAGTEPVEPEYEVEAVPWVFVAVTWKLHEPVALGVPDNVPLLVNVTPAGSEPLVTANVGVG